MRAGKRGAAADVFAGDADGGGEVAPELGMRAFGIFFFGEILHHGVAKRAFGAGGENAEVLGESFDVAVILRGVELERFAAEFAGLPILVERMVEQVFLGDCRVKAIEQMGMRHWNLHHNDGTRIDRGFRENFPRRRL